MDHRIKFSIDDSFIKLVFRLNTVQTQTNFYFGIALIIHCICIRIKRHFILYIRVLIYLGPWSAGHSDLRRRGFLLVEMT